VFLKVKNRLIPKASPIMKSIRSVLGLCLQLDYV
jgi:hypothetical protein